ncbi:FxSxx-COOH system tetratricopeptide repeat protein [Dactylosporangium sp. NPDC049140]|uniref:FxSxx-COOH system tetratricopeptide repeat protein n=1 Tax=Dactylosporangium sp. NPDC049140 TaxID=3155647 RepID=UPI0033DEDF78
MTDGRTGKVITFYSYKGGTGRTMALANVAWILAANGKRVLAADWDLESPGLHRYFTPFLGPVDVAQSPGVVDLVRGYEWETTREAPRGPDWPAELARTARYALPLSWDFPSGGSLDLLSTGRRTADYAVTLSGLDWDNFYNRGGGAFLDALRADMKRQYDYVLIDSRSGLSDVADICTLHLPDVLVDCFTFSEQGIEGAAAVAEMVVDQRRPIRVLPVPMRVDEGEKERADAGRTLAIRRFRGLPALMTSQERVEYWLRVEVPYRTFYAYEEMLATFGDLPGSRTSMLAAYEALTAYLTNGEVVGLPPMEESVRLRVMRRFIRPVNPSDPEAETEVRLDHHPSDQLWAEWVERLLATVGIRVAQPAGGGSTENTITRRLVIVSRAWLEARDGTRRPGGEPDPLSVYVDDLRPTPELPLGGSVFLAGLPPQAAVDRVLGLVGHRDAVLDAGELAMRYPGTRPAVFNVPVRNTRFTGRDDDLTALRNLFRAQPGGAPVVLQGMGGVGKSQLAIEYAHRFAGAYDVVWWVPADPAQFVDMAIADLGAHLGLPARPSVAEAMRATLAALRQGNPYGRWLLIFDNAEDPALVEGLLPQGGGDVLLTSRNSYWGDDRAQQQYVDVFLRRESVAHLRMRVPSMTAAEADRVADALGDLPIGIAAAGAWLADTGASPDQYLSGLDRPDLAIGATWDLSLHRLLDRSPAAYRMLQLCSVMSSEIALDLLYGDEFASALRDFDPTLVDRVNRGSLVQQVNRLALLKLDTVSRVVQVHRLLQAIVRSRMSEEELAEARHQVHRVLAQARPNGAVEDPATWPRYRILWPHLDASDALACHDELVRELLIDQVGFLRLQGSLERARERAEEIDRAWTDALGAEFPDRRHAARRQLLHLRYHRAIVLRELARVDEAYALDTEVLGAQRELLGYEHAHTLMTAGGLAADLRALGRYHEALELDRSTLTAWTEAFGDDYTRTLAARSGLATSYRLIGDFREARRHDAEVYDRNRVILGPDHPATVAAGADLARDLRDAGEYEASVALLTTIVGRFESVLGADATATLNAKVSLAAALRAAGRVDHATALADEAYAKLAEVGGGQGPDTLMARLSRAQTLLTAGNVNAARDELQAVHKAFATSRGPDHPVTLVCAANLVAALDDQDAASRRAVEGLAAAVGPDHPYSLLARANHGVVQAGSARDEAGHTLRDVRTAIAAALGPDHPLTLVVESNVVNLEASVSGARDTAALDRRMVQAFGEHHGAVEAFRAGQLVFCTLEAHPL